MSISRAPCIQSNLCKSGCLPLFKWANLALAPTNRKHQKTLRKRAKAPRDSLDSCAFRRLETSNPPTPHKATEVRAIVPKHEKLAADHEERECGSTPSARCRAPN